VIEATGTASGGQSTAAATVTATLAENGGTTAVTLTTNLTITGKPAQFGRGMIEDVGGKIIGQFADCLVESLAPQQVPVATAAGPPATPAASGLSENSGRPVRSAPSQPRVLPATPPATEEIDLLDAASGAVAKRVMPAITALAVLALLIRRWRRRC
jgi:hypothetical protein